MCGSGGEGLGLAGDRACSPLVHVLQLAADSLLSKSAGLVTIASMESYQAIDDGLQQYTLTWGH